MKLTKAQNAMLERAVVSNFDIDGYRGRRWLAGHAHLKAVCEKYGQPFVGAIPLRGSAQFRVARALEKQGLGSLCSNQVSDCWWFIAEVSRK